MAASVQRMKVIYKITYPNGKIYIGFTRVSTLSERQPERPRCRRGHCTTQTAGTQQ